MRLPAIAALAAVIQCAPAARATENDPTVPTYHADAARSGHYVFPGLTWVRGEEMRQDAAFDGRVPGHVYQPVGLSFAIGRRTGFSRCGGIERPIGLRGRSD